MLADERAAADYLERLRAAGTWIDQQTERLQIGAGNAAFPSAPLVQEAIEWAESCSGPPFPKPSPPPASGGMGRRAAWREELGRLAAAP